jgi:hypothetical protein
VQPTVLGPRQAQLSGRAGQGRQAATCWYRDSSNATFVSITAPSNADHKYIESLIPACAAPQSGRTDKTCK